MTELFFHAVPTWVLEISSSSTAAAAAAQAAAAAAAEEQGKVSHFALA